MIWLQVSKNTLFKILSICFNSFFFLSFSKRFAVQTHLLTFKDSEATCVEIATEIKKNALDWKTCSILMLPGIFRPYEHVLAALFTK